MIGVLTCKWLFIYVIMYRCSCGLRPVVVQKFKRVTITATGCGFDSR